MPNTIAQIYLAGAKMAGVEKGGRNFIKNVFIVVDKRLWDFIL